jgi:tRNA dimethylallyltransferase
MGSLSFIDMKEQLNIAIHQFAKRQMTWFRRMERNGYLIIWLDASNNVDDRVKKVGDLFKDSNLSV